MSGLMTSPTGLILICSVIVAFIVIQFVIVCGRPRVMTMFSKEDAKCKFEMCINTVFLCDDIGESCHNALYWIHPAIRARVGESKLMDEIHKFFKSYRVPSEFVITNVKMRNKDLRIEVVYICECTLEYDNGTGYRVYLEYHQDTSGDGMRCIEICNLSNKVSRGEHAAGFHVL